MPGRGHPLQTGNHAVVSAVHRRSGHRRPVVPGARGPGVPVVRTAAEPWPRRVVPADHVDPLLLR